MWGMTGRGRHFIAAAAALAAAVLATPCSAGSFRVNPVQINLPADEQAASLTITNSDVASVALRVLTFAWSQPDGVDQYSPTANLIVSPPIFTIPAGGNQLVRVAVRDRSAGRAYRVILQEIPRQKPADGQVRVALRLNLPLYILPPRGGKPDVRWRAWQTRDGTIFVEGTNNGSLHLQVTALSIEVAGHREPLSKEMGVVLPGSSRIWKAHGSTVLHEGETLTLKVRSSAGDIDAPVLLESR